MYLSLCPSYSVFFFFNDTATTEIYTLSLHDALPICSARWMSAVQVTKFAFLRSGSTYQICSGPTLAGPVNRLDRKSTRLNSSHLVISYAVFCLKKKKLDKTPGRPRLNWTLNHQSRPD